MSFRPANLDRHVLAVPEPHLRQPVEMRSPGLPTYPTTGLTGRRAGAANGRAKAVLPSARGKFRRLTSSPPLQRSANAAPQSSRVERDAAPASAAANVAQAMDLSIRRLDPTYTSRGRPLAHATRNPQRHNRQCCGSLKAPPRAHTPLGRLMVGLLRLLSRRRAGLPTALPQAPPCWLRPGCRIGSP
jgi:hypothetical protein